LTQINEGLKCKWQACLHDGVGKAPFERRSGMGA
jgi:hypothetical protein